MMTDADSPRAPICGMRLRRKLVLPAPRNPTSRTRGVGPADPGTLPEAGADVEGEEEAGTSGMAVTTTPVALARLSLSYGRARLPAHARHDASGGSRVRHAHAVGGHQRPGGRQLGGASHILIMHHLHQVIGRGLVD